MKNLYLKYGELRSKTENCKLNTFYPSWVRSVPTAEKIGNNSCIQTAIATDMLFKAKQGYFLTVTLIYIEINTNQQNEKCLLIFSTDFGQKKTWETTEINIFLVFQPTL